MPSVIEERPALHDALELLHEASRIPAKQRTVKVSGVVDAICRHASEDGLDEDALRAVVQLAAVKTSLDQTSVTTLVKNLYPALRVPDDVVVTVVGALGQGRGKPSPSTQDSLVQWLTAVHEITESPTILSRLYGVLFGMLDMISIRTSLCHLLALITRRKHVKPFRIQQLLEFSRGLGNEPALQGLLRVFKDYYPDIILGSTSTSRKSFAPQPDAEWRQKIFAVQEASTSAEDAAVDRHNGFKVLRKGPKRNKASAIPDVHTYHATETSVTLEGIDSVDDFVEKLDRIEPPGQLISFLTDPLLQKYLELRPSPIMSTRIDLWLATCLQDVVEAERSGTGDPQYLDEVFDSLLKHAQYTKTLHPTVVAFLEVYLPLWGGHNHIDAVLGLLVFVPFESYDNAYASLFLPAEQSLASQGIPACEKMMGFYTGLLQHRVCALLSRNSSIAESDRQIIYDLTAHVATFSSSLLLSLPPQSGKTLVSSVIAFYETLSTSSKPHVLPIILPQMRLIFLLAQEASSTTLSRVCGVIRNYKLAFDLHPKPVKDYYPVSVTEALNYCLLDVYNLIWASRGLLTADRTAVGAYCDPALRAALKDYLNSLDPEYAIGAALGLSNNPWLASLSAAAWRVMEESQIEKEGFDRDTIRYHQGPVSERSLEVLKKKGGVIVNWKGVQGYKVMALNWLADRGLGGLRDLMFATVKELKGKAQA